MAFQHRPNTGSLFKARGEKRTENSPDYTGSVLIAGVEYRLSGWITTSQNSGVKYISLRFESMEEVNRRRQQSTSRRQPNAEREPQSVRHPSDEREPDDERQPSVDREPIEERQPESQRDPDDAIY